jgi:hypothetical protein
MRRHAVCLSEFFDLVPANQVVMKMSGTRDFWTIISSYF